uniref:Uncharacterized protein n=1 Tax=Acrobeloides nanus TaxID=290746 RepID=A0A914C0T7_9BILA
MPIIEEDHQPNQVQKSLSCPASFELQAVKFRVKYLRDGRKVINGEFETTTPEVLWKQLIKNSLSTRLSTSDASTLSDLSDGEFEITTPVELWNQLIMHSLLVRKSNFDDKSSLSDSGYESATPEELWKQLINQSLSKRTSSFGESSLSDLSDKSQPLSTTESKNALVPIKLVKQIKKQENPPTKACQILTRKPNDYQNHIILNKTF